MKIVRLVLLLSLIGVPAACNGAATTEPEVSARVGPAPLLNGATPDTTGNRDDSGHLIGSGH